MGIGEPEGNLGDGESKADVEQAPVPLSAPDRSETSESTLPAVRSRRIGKLSAKGEQRIHCWLDKLGRALERKRGGKRFSEVFLKASASALLSYLKGHMSGEAKEIFVFVPIKGSVFYSEYDLDAEFYLEEKWGMEEELKRLEKIMQKAPTAIEKFPEERRVTFQRRKEAWERYKGSIPQCIKKLREKLVKMDAIFDIETTVSPKATVCGDLNSPEEKEVMEIQIGKIMQPAIEKGQLIIVEVKPGENQKTENIILIEIWKLNSSWVDKALFPPIEKKPKDPTRAVKRTRRRLAKNASIKNG